MWARACSYDFRAMKGMENFARSRLFMKALLAPLLAPGTLVVLQTACRNHRRPRWPLNLQILQMTDDGWISSMASAGARQACWLSSLGLLLVKLKGVGAWHPTWL